MWVRVRRTDTASSSGNRCAGVSASRSRPERPHDVLAQVRDADLGEAALRPREQEQLPVEVPQAVVDRGRGQHDQPLLDAARRHQPTQRAVVGRLGRAEGVRLVDDDAAVLGGVELEVLPCDRRASRARAGRRPGGRWRVPGTTPPRRRTACGSARKLLPVRVAQAGRRHDQHSPALRLEVELDEPTSRERLAETDPVRDEHAAPAVEDPQRPTRRRVAGTRSAGASRRACAATRRPPRRARRRTARRASAGRSCAGRSRSRGPRYTPARSNGSAWSQRSSNQARAALT